MPDREGDTEMAYRRARDAYRQAVEVETEAQIMFVFTPNEDHARTFREARGGLATAQLALNDRQHERLISAATLAQLAQLVGEQLDSKVQVLEDASARNYDMLQTISERLERLVAHAFAGNGA